MKAFFQHLILFVCILAVNLKPLQQVLDLKVKAETNECYDVDADSECDDDTERAKLSDNTEDFFCSHEPQILLIKLKGVLLDDKYLVNKNTLVLSHNYSLIPYCPPELFI